MISEENRKVFESAGRFGTQKLIASGMASRERIEQAYEWLDEQVQAPQVRLIKEQTRLARSANRAAWLAAIVAIIAATIAAISVPHPSPGLSWFFSLFSFL